MFILHADFLHKSHSVADKDNAKVELTYLKSPTTVCFEPLVLRLERLISILQFSHEFLKLVLDAFWKFVELCPLQSLE